MERREFVAALGAAAAALAVPPPFVHANEAQSPAIRPPKTPAVQSTGRHCVQTLATRPATDGFWMPAEWAPQEAVWMLWPYRNDNWRESALPAQRNYAAVADAISGAMPVLMGVPGAFIPQAKRVLPASVTVVPMDSDDAWARDCGPTVVIDAKGERRGVDWIFNAWGGLKGGLYYPWDKDEQVAPQICAYHGFTRYQAAIVVEGGGIHTDGDGTCLLTEEVHLNPNRNPGLTKAQIATFLRDYMNVDKLIWLPLGVAEDETSGHVDNMCCFARPGEVILTWTDDQKDPQYGACCEIAVRGVFAGWNGC